MLTSKRVQLAAVALLTACGGGGGGGDRAIGDSSDYAQQCAPSNPFRADALQTTTTATLAREKQWARAYMDETYLWYREIPEVDPGLAGYTDTSDIYASLENYFLSLLTPAVTPSGRSKDQFSFIYPTRPWLELAQSGSAPGYGLELRFNPYPPRDMRIVFVEPGSPADGAGVSRGMRLTHVDGVSTESSWASDVDVLNAGLFPAASGEAHSFGFEALDGAGMSVGLVATDVVRDPVPAAFSLQADGAKVGYLLFNHHFATAEHALIDAIASLRDAGIDDLVLDLRYNGGGYLYVASQLAYMIAGGARTAGKVFERLELNDKRPAETEFYTTPFYDCTSDRDFDCGGNPNLPALNLDRVYVITSGGTCSASESVINGLRGVDLDVRLVGGTTCGKPYGFLGRDNCGISYFPIEFQGVNQKGFGGYADGFAPDCATVDDLSRTLGDATEASLAMALALRNGGACPPAKVLPASGRLVRSPARENRFLLPQPAH